MELGSEVVSSKSGLKKLISLAFHSHPAAELIPVSVSGVFAGSPLGGALRMPAINAWRAAHCSAKNPVPSWLAMSLIWEQGGLPGISSVWLKCAVPG